MREARFRSGPDADYGLPAHRPVDDLGEAFELLRAGALERLRWERVRRALRGRTGLRVSIGSGRDVPPGWVGLDLRANPPKVLHCDLRRPLPLADDAVDAVLAEHVLEHLDLDDVVRLLAECRRVLRPRAPLRVVSPDVVFLTRLVNESFAREVVEHTRYDAEIHGWPDEPLRRWRAVNRMTHQWGAHRSILGEELMRLLLERLGFDAIVRCGPRDSTYFADPPGTHGDRFTGPDHEAFAIEALA